MFDLDIYSPNDQLRQIRRLVDRLMDEFLSISSSEPYFISPIDSMARFMPGAISSIAEFFPGDNLAVDLYEKGDKLVVKAALPGVQKKDIELTEQGGFLTIRAKSEASEERDMTGWYIRERRYEAWQRTLRLPMKVDVNRAKAVLENGVLTITLPKLESQKPLLHRIKVNMPKVKLPFNGRKTRKIQISHK